MAGQTHTAFEPQGGEQALITALDKGEPCVFLYEEPYKQPDSQRTIRAEVLGKILRSEALGSEGLTVVIPRAVIIVGAIITGELDMSDTNTGLALGIQHSEFKAAINFNQAKLALLNLEGSTLVGANMNFLQIATNLQLNDLKSKGAFNLASAKIGGQFAAHNAKFTNPKGMAINAQGAEITGGVFLHKTKITGMAAFNRAKIGGQFAADGAEFLNPEGRAINAQDASITGGVFLWKARVAGIVDFGGTKIGGQFAADGAEFINPTGTALLMQGAVVKGGAFLLGFPHPAIGAIDLHSAQFTTLVIDDNSYPLGRLILDGTRYTQLLRKGGIAHTECAGWLVPPKTDLRKRQRLAFGALFENREHFPFLRITYDKRAAILGLLRETQESAQSHKRSPFAYRQFSKTLDANGHEREAREVRILAGDAYTARTVPAIKTKALKLLYRRWRQILRFTTGYGEKLHYAVFWLVGLLILGSLLFTYFTPDMMPSKERFYLADGDGEAYDLYKKTGQLPAEYPKFSPIFYSLDVMIPIVDIAQESHWRPRNKTWNWPRYYNRFHLLMGWFLSTLAIAGLTGLLQDKREP